MCETQAADFGYIFDTRGISGTGAAEMAPVSASALYCGCMRRPQRRATEIAMTKGRMRRWTPTFSLCSART
ncbi:MAG: hypothetical protein QOE53_2603 [Pseudonocardiales bacterium]|jgi:hypothetical protein|nr:hypothetical protein [Pseudonocardiales bacterium]